MEIRSDVDLNDFAESEAILREVSYLTFDTLRWIFKQNVNNWDGLAFFLPSQLQAKYEGVKFRWKVQPDGKIFQKKETQERKPMKSRGIPAKTHLSHDDLKSDLLSGAGIRAKPKIWRVFFIKNQIAVIML